MSATPNLQSSVNKHAVTTAPLIDVQNVSFSYEKGGASLVDVSLEVHPGEIVCLMGPNGCGKTTLIDTVLGEHTPSSGEVLVTGQPVNKIAPQQLASYLSYVPQNHTRSFPYTVEHIVLMGTLSHRDMFDRPTQEDRDTVAHVMQQVGISHLATKPYTQISGGETQLVMLARALAQQAAAIVMDEPTAHLDFRNDLMFVETVATLVREGSMSSLIATHSPNQAYYFEGQGVPTRVVLLKEGRVVDAGTPSKVLTQACINDLYQISSQIMTGRYRGHEYKQVAPLATQQKEAHD